MLGPANDEFGAAWGWMTVAASTVAWLSYAITAFNWYFQRRLSSRGEDRRALGLLGSTLLICVAAGAYCYASDVTWLGWRAYDAVLLLTSVALCSFILRTKGLGLIEERLADEADKQRAVQRKLFFFNALSHDIRSPLSNIVLTAELAKRKPQLLADSATRIIESARDASDLLGKLLDFAKMDARDENQVTTVCLPSMLAHLVRRFERIAAAKGLTLRLDCDAQQGEVASDRTKLERVIGNLVDNAIKYTNAGGVTLSLERVRNEFVVKVEDTGIGIPACHVDSLFDAFYQVDNADADRSKGFGLGLSICQNLARQVNSEIRLAHTGDAGSCFELVVRNCR